MCEVALKPGRLVEIGGFTHVLAAFSHVALLRKEASWVAPVWSVSARKEIRLRGSAGGMMIKSFQEVALVPFIGR